MRNCAASRKWGIVFGKGGGKGIDKKRIRKAPIRACLQVLACFLKAINLDYFLPAGRG